MRCFVAVNFTESFKKQLNSELLPLINSYPDMKWVKNNNFHLTIRFYGDIELYAVNQLIEKMNELAIASFQFID